MSGLSDRTTDAAAGNSPLPEGGDGRRGHGEEGTGRTLVCPWWLCFTFDNPLRRWLHMPDEILAPYVFSGNRAIDIGPGMGYFTIPLAGLVGPSGHVTAIDIQPRMLAALARRALRQGLQGRIETHLADGASLGRHPAADFILAFWMVHEVPDRLRFFAEIRTMLKPDGRFLLVEPRIHVSEKDFVGTLADASAAGLVIRERPHIRMSRGAVLMRGKDGVP